jgi:ATPase subunit of ABC transporter with duplicated ATPase domains
MLSTSGISLSFGKRTLFDDVNITFSPGRCFGLIGANGSGKSTFIKILSGEIESSTGDVILEKNARMAVLSQNHNAFDSEKVLQTVIMGHKTLFEIMIEKDAIYAKPDFSEADGVRAGELEAEFAELNGWDAEPEAANLLEGLGIPTSKHDFLMKDLEQKEKVRILLAQAIFGSPDVLLLDEPTNGLDRKSIEWLENFLMDFNNTVIVVSHDRHFLDSVCTNIADIDYGKISIFTGNYTFWYQSSQLALEQKREANKKTDNKRKELEDFVRRFSANASKSKQASSRKKLLEKLNVDEIKPSTRKYPHIHFGFEKELGNSIFACEGLKYTGEDGVLFDNLNLSITDKDKIVVLGENDIATTRFLELLAGQIKTERGEMKFGSTVIPAYLPNQNISYFDVDLNLVDWLRQYTDEEDEQFIRGFLGKMLFSGEESLKKANVLSGGEKVRCMMSRMMLMQGNFLLLDDPTDHLDLESITALNNGMIDYKGVMLFKTQDHELARSVANRIIEIGPGGIIDSFLDYDDYVKDPEIQRKRNKIYLR